MHNGTNHPHRHTRPHKRQVLLTAGKHQKYVARHTSLSPANSVSTVQSTSPTITDEEPSKAEPRSSHACFMDLQCPHLLWSTHPVHRHTLIPTRCDAKKCNRSRQQQHVYAVQSETLLSKHPSYSTHNPCATRPSRSIYPIISLSQSSSPHSTNKKKEKKIHDQHFTYQGAWNLIKAFLPEFFTSASKFDLVRTTEPALATATRAASARTCKSHKTYRGYGNVAMSESHRCCHHVCWWCHDECDIGMSGDKGG